jgi:alpha-L-rhamnosidase
MGILSPSDWKAAWINDGKTNPMNDADFYKEDPAPLFRREFEVSSRVCRARLAITGLGYYSASINGKSVSDQELGPAWTRYSKRVYYTVLDVTRMLRIGDNCIGVTLGNGWWNPLPLRMWGTYNLRDSMPVGRPRFIAQLEIDKEDGSHETVVSDTSWRVADGPLRFNSIYLGEVYDARNDVPGWDSPGFDASGWRWPGVPTEQIGQLQAQSQPPIQITRTLPIVNVTEPKPGVYIFDMGQNFGGWVRLNVKAPAGARIVLRYGELLNKDGTINPMTSVAGQIKGTHKLPDGTTESVGGPGAPPVAWQSDTYIAAGKGAETYLPRFTFHGFRYVEITGLNTTPTRDMLVGLRLNSNVDRVGAFTCSNPLLNRIQQMCDNTFLSNIFSVQSDCPHRERFGYGGDLAATSEAFIMNYDMDRFYAKAIADFQDSALPDGTFTDTAPFVGIQYCGFAWAMAPAIASEQLARYYGDTVSYSDTYTAIRKWLTVVDKQFPEGIVNAGLSDHESITTTEPALLITPLYYNLARSLLATAEGLSHNEPYSSQRYLELNADAGMLYSLANRVYRAYESKYVDKETGKVGDDTQANLAIALGMHIVPEPLRSLVLKRLVEQIDGPDKGHLTTGIFGTKYLLDVLSREGRGDLAYKIVTQTTYPGWGYMVENGATTLWEHWQGSDNTYSQNHPMFGSVSQWLFQWIGGIEPVSIVDNGWSGSVAMHPLFLPELNEAKCSYRSIRGNIVCNWRRQKDGIHLDVEVPVGMRANIIMPTDHSERITEAGTPLKQGNGIDTFFSSTDLRTGPIYCGVGSGVYHFVIAPE